MSWHSEFGFLGGSQIRPGLALTPRRMARPGVAIAAGFLCACFFGCRVLELLQWDQRNLLTTSRPARVLAFEVRDARGQPLWRISAATPQLVERIEYGKSPVGFVQTAPPSNAPPRAFVSGEELLIITELDSREFRHSGSAVGANAFAGGVWESIPRQPTSKRPKRDGKRDTSRDISS